MTTKDIDDATQIRILFWFVLFSAIWLWWIIHHGNEVYAKAAAEHATQTGLSYLWHSNDANKARLWVYGYGILGFGLLVPVAYVFAFSHTAFANAAAARKQEIKNEREQLVFDNKMQDMERDNDKQANLSKAAQSKQELIMRLGSIDQYIRVLAIETDVSQRTVALQAAHSEMTTLAAKLASDQITREALDAPEIREHASETSNDLVRLGLSEDRLNRDIKRMFKLGAN